MPATRILSNRLENFLLQISIGLKFPPPRRYMWGNRFEIHAFFAAYMNHRPRPCSLALNEYIGEPILLTVYMYTFIVFRYWSAVTGPHLCTLLVCVLNEN